MDKDDLKENVTGLKRSGKGVSCVIPTCVSDFNSPICLDFKGKNFIVTSAEDFKKKLK